MKDAAAHIQSVAAQTGVAKPTPQPQPQPNWPSKVDGEISGKRRTNNPPKRK